MISNLSQKESKGKDYKKKILSYLKENPAGSTVTDIALGIKTSRITVSKYISVLEATKEVFSEKIGAYKLYFTSERSFIPKRLIISYYAGLLSFLKEEFNNVNKFKEIGRYLAKFIPFPYGSEFPDDVMPTKKGTVRRFLKYLGKALPYIDFIHGKIDIQVNITEEGNIAKYLITNVELFDNSEDFDIHFYMVSGIIEELVSKTIQKKCICNVVNIDVLNKSVEILIEIV